MGGYLLSLRLLLKDRSLKKRVEAVCQGVPTSEEWTKERKIHINILELKTANLALLAFSKQIKKKAIHFQIDNMTALSYLLKM